MQVGDEVTVEFDNEGEPDQFHGVITGFKRHSETGEEGFWLKYTDQIGDKVFGPYISWWSMDSVKDG